MPDIIQQLLDLKEWSQNPERYERRMNFRGGQLVQPGPGRQGYNGKYEDSTLYKKREEAKEIGKVWDKKTKRMRESKLVGPLSGPKKAGAGVQMTIKEALKIRETLPENMFLIKDKAHGWNYKLHFTKKKGGKPEVHTRAARPENLEFLLNQQEELIEQYHPKRLTNAKFEQMRMLDENASLTQKEFLKKLKGWETSKGNKWTIGSVIHAEKTLELGKFLPRIAYGRTLSEATEIIKNRGLTGQADLTDIYKRLPGAQNKEARLKDIQKLATRIVGREAEMTKKGMFSPEKSRSGYLWNNFYESMGKNPNIKMEGTFNGKSLKFRKNWPRDAEGKINFSIKDPQTNKAAWKEVKFTDMKTPSGKVTYTFDTLATQVDDAFGKGFFKRSTTPYVAQKELWGKMYKGEPIGKYVARENIIKEYQAKPGNAGKMPTEKYINNRMSHYTPAQVHHWGERGVKGDPYRTQLTSRTANRAVNAAESTYNKKLRLAGNDSVKIADAKKWFKNEIQNISKEHGGIKYTVDGKVVGGKTTPVSIYSTELKKLVKNDNAAIKMLKQAGFRCKQNVGGVESVACYLRDARNQLKSVKNRQPGMGRKLARFRNFGKKALLWGFGPADIVIEALFAAHGVASGHGKDQIWADSLLGMVIPQSLGGPEWGDEMRLDKIAELGGEEYADALNQEKEFNSLLDKYYDVDKIPDKIRGHDATGYKEKLYADLDKVWDEYAAGKEYLTVPEDARPTELDEKGEPLWPRNLGPRDQVMKWSQDLNPDSFAAEKFRIANEKLQAEEAAIGQASGVSPIRLETQEAENIRKTRDIGEHPRGEDYWTEFFRTLRGWDPAWRGPEGTGYSFRHEGMDYMAGGGIAGIRRPNAIPPESGPMPQGGGLSSQFNRVKKLTG
jgi:hypothetical protein